MNLNFIELSNLQAELDKHISEEKSIKHENYLLEKLISLCVELGELMNERPFLFKYWKTHKTGDREKALTEYVDGLHFLLSYGNAIKFDFTKYNYKKPVVHDQRVLILGLFAMFADLHLTKQFEIALNHYILLSEKLNFSHEEIQKEYLSKNHINHQRQESGY